MSDVKYVTVDIETNSLNPFRGEIHLIGYYLPEHNYYGIFGKDDMMQGLTDLYHMAQNGYKFVWQNGKFDNKWIDKKFNLDLPLDEDVMLLSYVLDMGGRKSLDYLVEKHFGQPSWDISLKEKTKDTPETRDYLKQDLYWTWRLFQKFHGELDERTTKVYYDLVLPSYRAYAKVEKNGIAINVPKLIETIKEFEQKRDAAHSKLLSVANINWNSTQQVSEILFGNMLLPILARTRKGAPSTDASVLRKLAKMGHTICEDILEYKWYEKSLGTFLNKWLEEQVDGRIYPTFNIDITRTGRTSSSKPNLQQVPRDTRLRSLFTARPGYILLEADQSQVELRIAAFVANEENMKQVYRNGEDLHTQTARAIAKTQTPSKQDRTKAKPVNFGFLYGMQAKSFPPYAEDNYDVVYTLEEAQEYRDRFFSSYPGLVTWYKRQEIECKTYGGVFTMFGRFRPLPDIYSNQWGISEGAKRQAINTPVQSAASDILLGGLIDICNNFPQVIPVGTVHDSILMEVPVELVETLGPKIQKTMEQPSILNTFGIVLDVPLKADADFGDWGTN